MLPKGKMKTFGELSDTIAGTVIAKFQFASQVHIVPDRYDLEVIYQTRATVFHRDIQTPRRELKIRRAAEYF